MESLLDAHVAAYKTTEGWRRICEASHVCLLPTKDARRHYLNEARKKRRPEAMAVLEADIQVMWTQRRVHGGN